MKFRIMILFLMVIVLAGCSQSPEPVAQVELPAATPLPADTATPTPLPSATPLPTNTPEPTATFTPTATPVPETISAENVSRLQLVRRYGSGQMIQTAWSPDGSQVYVLTSIHLRAYDPQTGDLAWEVETGSPQKQMVVSADGKTIRTISADGMVLLWEVGSQQPPKTLLAPQERIELSTLSLSGDRAVLINFDKKSTVWDVNTGKELASNDGASVPMGIIGALVSSGDSVFWTNGFGSGQSQQIQAWEIATGKFLRGMKGSSQLYVTQLAVSPDGSVIAGISRLAVTSQPSYELLVWDVETGNLLQKINFSDDIHTFAFVPGQRKAYLAIDNGTIVPVDLETGKPGGGFGRSKTAVISMAVSADGAKLSAAGADGIVRVFDLANNDLIHEIEMDVSLSVAPYETSGENYILRYDLYNGIGTDQDGKSIAVLSHDRMKIDLIDPATLKIKKSTNFTMLPLDTIAMSQDGKVLAAADSANQIILYHASSGGIKNIIRAEQVYRIHTLGFSPDGSQIASLSGGHLGELYVYDTETGQRLFTLSGGNTFSYSPDGKQIVSDNIDFGIYLWDAVTGKKMASPAADWIYDLAYAPDGNTVAVAGVEIHQQIKNRDNVITLFDPNTYTALPLKMTGHPVVISKLRYSPDGSLLASLDRHGNLRLWDAATGELLKDIRETVPAPVQMLFMPDGRTLIVGGGDGTLLFFEVR